MMYARWLTSFAILGFNSYKYFLLPMANDSTPSYLTTDCKNTTMKSPRQSSLTFVRQFARVYISYGKSELTAFIAN